MRSSTTRCPPASATATAMAMPAVCARSTAMAAMCLAPWCVSRFVAVTYMTMLDALWCGVQFDLAEEDGGRRPGKLHQVEGLIKRRRVGQRGQRRIAVRGNSATRRDAPLPTLRRRRPAGGRLDHDPNHHVPGVANGGEKQREYCGGDQVGACGGARA